MQTSTSISAIAVAICLPFVAAISLTIDADTPVVLPSSDSTALQASFRDFQLDWYEAFGQPPTVYDSFPTTTNEDPATTPIVLFGYPSLLNATFSGLKLNESCVGASAEPESHCIQTLSRQGSGSQLNFDVIAAVGSDRRGAQFAIYSFSEILLGMNPWKHFADQRPVQIQTIVLPADGAPGGEWFFPPFLFKHRAGFPNDEDLLGNSQPSPMGDSVWSDTAYDKYYETSLRLKLNGVLVGTNPAPDERSVALAARRGLIIHHHHYNLLGSWVYQWPLGKAGWNWKTDTQSMGYMYQASVAAQADKEVLWSVGLRGTNDYAYPCTTDEDCAQQINECMGNQTKWIHQAQPEGADQVTYLWSEGVRYLSKGLLHIPNGTDVIFGDQGAGFVHGDGNLTQYASGLYYHTAMYNDHANQLTEMIPVSRIIAQIYQIFIALAKKYSVFVLNTSDMRPVGMTTNAAFRITRNPDEFFDSLKALAETKMIEYKSGARASAQGEHGAPADIEAARSLLQAMGAGKTKVEGAIGEAWMSIDPNATALLYYEQWAREQYGLGANPNAAASVAKIWATYFQVSYIQAGYSDNMLAASAQTLAGKAATEIAQDGVVSASSMKAANEALTTCDNTTQGLLASMVDDTAPLLAQVPVARRQYANYHLLVGLIHQQYGCRALAQIASAVLAANASDFSQAETLAQAAVSSYEYLTSMRMESEYGQWRDMYFGDHLSNFAMSRRNARQLVVAIAAAGKHPILPGITIPHWYAFEDYQNAFKDNFPLMHYNTTWRMSDFVRVHCDVPDYDTGACVNTPEGGHFRSPAAATATAAETGAATDASTDTDITMFFGPPGGSDAPGLKIFYTVDGSVPSPSSKLYSGPLDLNDLVPAGSQHVSIRARAQVNGTMLLTDSDTTWSRW